MPLRSRLVLILAVAISAAACSYPRTDAPPATDAAGAADATDAPPDIDMDEYRARTRVQVGGGAAVRNSL